MTILKRIIEIQKGSELLKPRTSSNRNRKLRERKNPFIRPGIFDGQGRPVIDFPIIEPPEYLLKEIDHKAGEETPFTQEHQLVYDRTIDHWVKPEHLTDEDLLEDELNSEEETEHKEDDSQSPVEDLEPEYKYDFIDWDAYGSKTSQVEWIEPLQIKTPKGNIQRQSLTGAVIPPAWKNVKINKDPKGIIQVTGQDKKGQVVQLRSNDWHNMRSKVKYDREKEFSKKLPNLRKKYRADFSKREEAVALFIIDKTGFRIGTEGLGTDHRGVTTLTVKDVKVKGMDVTFDFIGKSGVKNNRTISSRGLANFILKSQKNKKTTDKIFNVTGSKVNRYMQKEAGMSGFSVKDFRTHQGTELAKQLIKEYPLPTTQKEFKAIKKNVAEAVSAWLHNKPGVALGNYINPQVFSKHEKAAGVLKKAITNSWRDYWHPSFDLVVEDHSYMPEGFWDGRMITSEKVD